MEQANGAVTTFAYVNSLIYEVIDLCENLNVLYYGLSRAHLSWNCLTADAKELGVRKYTGPGCCGSQG